MSTTSQQAERECVTLFKDAATAAFASYPQHYDGVESNDPPTDQCWFRWTFQHTDSNQASLSCEHGERRWRREGFIIIQCFGLLDAGGKTVAQRMAEVCRDAYQGADTPSGVWFRGCTTSEIGRDGKWYQVNAIIRFEYDSIRGNDGDVIYPPPAITPPLTNQYNFLTPSLQWVINHNMGRRVSVEPYTIGGNSIWAQITHVSLNQTVVTFDTPQDGYAIIDF